MPKACKVPTSGSDSGKYSLAKTSPVTVLYRKKSYHSIVVPIVLAITARRNCTRCSNSESAPAAIPTAVIEAPPHASPRAVFLLASCGRAFRRRHPRVRDILLHGGGEQNDAADNRCAAGDHSERTFLEMADRDVPVILGREAQGCGYRPDHHAQNSKR